MGAKDMVQLPKQALRSSLKALDRLANYTLEPGIQSRMRELGERKEFLSESERAELLSLVEFSERRLLESLEAKVALRELNSVSSVL